MDEDVGHFYDDGTEVFPDLIAKPSLCVSCAKDDEPDDEHLCALTRLDQQDEEDFQCEAYVAKVPD